MALTKTKPELRAGAVRPELELGGDAANFFDVVLVGCGLHGLTLLAKAPELLRFRVAIVDKAHKLGGGAMRRYVVPTNSNASKFLWPFKSSPLFSGLFDSNSSLSRLLLTDAPIRCDLVGEGLEVIGGFLSQRDNPTVFLGREVTSINCDLSNRTTTHRFALTSNDSSKFHSKVCILATGRAERVSPYLQEWRNKLVLSSSVLEGRCSLSTLLRSGSRRRIAIIGASHGAFSVLGLVLDHISSNQQGDVLIDLLHKDDVALYYPSLDTARREQVEGQEKMFMADRDLCPETGAVFRDSGLRGPAKEMYRNIVNRTLSMCRMVRIEDLSARVPDLSQYDHVVQALGSLPSLPSIEIDGQTIDEGTFNVASDGQVLPINGQSTAPLFALRVIPTQDRDKDHNPESHDVYPRLAASICSILEQEKRYLVGERTPK